MGDMGHRMKDKGLDLGHWKFDTGLLRVKILNKFPIGNLMFPLNILT